MSNLVPMVLSREGKNERVMDLFSKMLEERIIYINGVITAEMAELIVPQLHYLENMAGDEDITIFPTTVEEVQEHLSDAVKRMGEKLEKEKYELNNKIQAFETAKDFVSGQTSAKLTETSYEEITTAEFNKEQKQKKIEEINSN